MAGLALERGERSLERLFVGGREQPRLVVHPRRERMHFDQGLADRRDEQSRYEQSKCEDQDACRAANQNWTAGGLSPTSSRASKVGFGSTPITFAVSTAGNERTSVL